MRYIIQEFYPRPDEQMDAYIEAGGYPDYIDFYYIKSFVVFEHGSNGEYKIKFVEKLKDADFFETGLGLIDERLRMARKKYKGKGFLREDFIDAWFIGVDWAEEGSIQHRPYWSTTEKDRREMPIFNGCITV